MHYTEVSKADVLLNFCLAGAQQNPYAHNNYDSQDVSHWIIPMVERLMVLYLGLYTKKYTISNMPEIFHLSLYDLVERLRKGLFCLPLVISA